MKDAVCLPIFRPYGTSLVYECTFSTDIYYLTVIQNGTKRDNLTALPLGIRGFLYQNLPPTGGG